MKNIRRFLWLPLCLLLSLTACSPQTGSTGDLGGGTDQGGQSNMGTGTRDEVTILELPNVAWGETTAKISRYTDENGDIAVIPAGFKVSAKAGEQTVNTGVVIIGSDGSEFVWIPTTETKLAVRDFGSYFSGGSISGYWDETEQPLYQEMVKA